MKTKRFFIVIFFLSFIAILYSYSRIIYDDIGPHGGIVKSVGNYNIEMKVSKPDFQAYLLDSRLNPISNKGMSCEIRFYLYDSSTLDIDLKPFGEDGFVMESGINGYHYYNVIFSFFGKQIRAKFEDENVIVLNK